MSKQDYYEDLKSFIIDWNNRYPVDRWWREKHKIAFGSSEHRSSCFIDQRLEYEEDILFDRLRNGKKNEYEPGLGDWLKKRKVKYNQKDIEKMFDDIDLSKFNKNG